MLRRTSSFASLSVLLACAACSSSSSSTPAADNALSVAKSSVQRDAVAALPANAATVAATANNAFAVDLYGKVLAASPAGSNVVTSPISASLALTMTYAGASGDTATQMATVLHVDSSAGSIFDGQNALSAALASRAATALSADQKTATQNDDSAPSSDDYVLQVVNSVWGQQTYPWATPFLDTLARSYGTGVFLEDFVHDAEPARTAINDWVSTQTDDKITGLLPEGSIDDTTRLVLVNAIHLKLPWATPFQVSATAPATFTRTDGSTESTPFMNQGGTLPYVDDGQAQIVGLPLSGGQLEVVIALPHGELATYEAALSTGSAALAAPAASAPIALSLPKFDFTSAAFSLAKALQALGMTDAFSPGTSDFTGMCAVTPDGDKLYISDVLQKATVAMAENGVEAAAATAVITSGASIAEPTPTPVTVNHPFLFSIVDVPTGAVLFLGHIEDPSVTASN